MLDKEFNYYLKHQNELLEKYNNRYLVIVGENVVGDYDKLEDALQRSGEKYKLGTFLIQECTEGDSAYTATFHSRVRFN
ncbi:MAG: DUF5678 domain-containing protein [Chitinivibrionia bacterium]|jgi:hypothetical protein|nr:DUF5678 domain-containing protein [Chitinivibrionia bacterium]